MAKQRDVAWEGYNKTWLTVQVKVCLNRAPFLLARRSFFTQQPEQTEMKRSLDGVDTANKN